MDPYSNLNTFLTHPLQHSPNPNPNPNPNLNPIHHEPQYSVAAPDVQPHPSLSSLLGYDYGTHQPYFHQPQAVDASTQSLYPIDPNYNPNAVASELLAQYAALSYSINAAAMAQKVGTEQSVVTHPNTTATWNNNVTAQPNGIISPWKKWPKKTKLVQSAWCEVCKLACNSKEVLDRHKLGKRHKKNLELLINPVVGPQENPEVGQKSEKPAETVEDLLTKRRKVLECGAAVSAVRICTLCNVVCNSETVFRYHLSGQKHVAMFQKYAAAQVGFPANNAT